MDRPRTDAEKIDHATEGACHVLLLNAKALGLNVEPVMGLMYLPDQRVTVQFQEACRAVIACLTPPATRLTG